MIFVNGDSDVMIRNIQRYFMITYLSQKSQKFTNKEMKKKIRTMLKNHQPELMKKIDGIESSPKNAQKKKKNCGCSLIKCFDRSRGLKKISTE